MTATTHEIEKMDTSPVSQATVKEGNGRTIIPDVDIIEKADHYILIADMPGADEKTLDITVEKDLLTIRGRMLITIPENHRALKSEFRSGNYQRAFRIYEEIDRDGIKATFHNGVLKLTIPKSENARIKKIAIESA